MFLGEISIKTKGWILPLSTVGGFTANTILVFLLGRGTDRTIFSDRSSILGMIFLHLYAHYDLKYFAFD